METILRKLTPMPEASKAVGSRTKAYELVGLGILVAVKLGSRTMIDTISLANYLENLPAAKISPPRRQSRSGDLGVNGQMMRGPAAGAEHMNQRPHSLKRRGAVDG